MAIKTTVGVLVAALDNRALASFEAGRPPWKIRFACAKLCRAMHLEYQSYAKLRESLIREYGIEDPETHVISVAHKDNTPERITAFNDNLKALLDSPVTLDVDPIPAASLGEDCPLTVGELSLLDPFIVE